MGVVSNDLIDEIYEAAKAAGLHSVTHRGPLLVGINTAATGLIPGNSLPALQLVEDLNWCNQRLADGSVPLVRWLQNAVKFTDSFEHGAKFRDLLKQVATASGPPCATKGSNPADFDAPTPHSYSLPALGLFVGRDQELDHALRLWLADPARPLLIWGPPGIGKSTLGLAMLQHDSVAARFGERRYYLRCDPHTSTAAMIAAMGVEWFGLRASPEIEGQVVHRLREAPAAVLVDNFETPHRADPVASEAWLRRLAGVPGLRLIVGVQGHERPGGVDWAGPVEPKPLSSDAARELFAGITRVDSHRRDAALNGLLQDLDGIPHAIELLAHQAVGAANLQPLVKRWKASGVAMLNRVGGRSRETSLKLAYEFAIGSTLLDDHARRLLRVLACLPGGVEEADIESVMAPDGAWPVLDANAALGRAALVYSERGRARMLAPLRDHVRRAHPAGEDAGPALEFYLRLAREGDKVGREGGAAALAALTTEFANVSWAVERAIDQADSRAVADARSLGEFTTFSGIGDGRLLTRLVGECRRSNNRLGEAGCIQSLGHIALRRSDHDKAREAYEQARPIYRELGARLGEANCIYSLGDIALASNDQVGAGEQFLAALDLYRSISEPYSIGWALRRLARLESDRGRRKVLLDDAVGNWQRAKFDDLVAGLRREFPGEC